MLQPKPSEPRRRSRRRLVAATVCLLMLGCASTAQLGDLAPILPASEARLETAPPAARDALDEGLRWIVEDAPKTKMRPSDGDESGKKGAGR